MAAESSPTLPLDTRRSSLAISKSLLWIAGAVLAWFAIGEVATEAWYRWKENQIAASSAWEIKWPDEQLAASSGFYGLGLRELGSSEKEILRFEEGKAASWKDSQGYSWTGFLLSWKDDKRLNNTDIAHNPTICLPSAGLELVATLPRVDLDLKGVRFSFNSWEFKAGNEKVFVFTAVRRNREFPQIAYGREMSERRAARWLKVVQGQRGNPLETIQLAVLGPRTYEEACAALRMQMKSLTR